MTALLVIGAIVLALIALILALPCRACDERRKRLRAAYEQWRRSRASSHH